jgi:CoA-dependent NAD(P)H sulfur oxidoreductase
MRIIIIGGEAAGMSAAAKAKRMDKNLDIVVYEKSDIVSFGACGLPYYVGDFFDDSEYMVSRSVEATRNSGIDVKILHEITDIDTNNKKVTVKNLSTSEVFEDSYDKLMIATGATPNLPKINATRLKNIFCLKTMEDGLKLKAEVLKNENKEVIIIGTGFIGIETAHAMHKMGKNVTLIGMNEHILHGVFDTEIATVLEEELLKNSIVLKNSESVISIDEDIKLKVITDKGEYNADIVVIAIGSSPNIQFLSNTNISICKGAIEVDRHGKTSDPNIYAAGDCALTYNFVKDSYDYIPLATSANKMGRIVGENLAGVKTSFQGSLGSICIKVMDEGAGRTGITVAQGKELGIDCTSILVKDKNHSNYYTNQEDILVKLVYDIKSNVILGAQIVGKEGAVLRVDVIAAAIYKKMTCKELSMLDLCYAPPFSRPWDVLNIAGSIAK